MGKVILFIPMLLMLGSVARADYACHVRDNNGEPYRQGLQGQNNDYYEARFQSRSYPNVKVIVTRDLDDLGSFYSVSVSRNNIILAEASGYNFVMLSTNVDGIEGHNMSIHCTDGL